MSVVISQLDTTCDIIQLLIIPLVPKVIFLLIGHSGLTQVQITVSLYFADHLCMYLIVTLCSLSPVSSTTALIITKWNSGSTQAQCLFYLEPDW